MEGNAMVNKENAKQQIKELLEKYRKIVEENRVGKYNEEMTKAEFIEPLFEALGWDVRNKTHRDEVTREETISKKRVDYGFRIDGIPKFFLEAKALKADLDKPEFAEQAINYAWHKGCTWAVLTDFESVKIFNAEWKTTTFLQSRFFSLDYRQFLERFDQLWLLSKESFEQGLLDKEAEKWGKKSKKNPVGDQLLSDLTKWRAKLSKDILQRNKDKQLTEEELDEAVQRIIDRLIFIRNCEDRELEPITLLSTMREWGSKHKSTLAERIIDVFSHFNAEYNSELFKHSLCDDLDISNQVLEEVINGLDHTEDRTIKYDFSALDADVLGNVYEQYLGHILKKTKKRADIKESHARRKEQGIYYTPTYIVDYIVRNTLGELLKDKKIDVEKIRVLDPACGSGSFLIKVFDTLDKYHSKRDRDYNQARLDLETGTTFTKKVEILRNNIFGVDLDPKAVEIAQLNLLLKIAEKKQRLPMLHQNIKCGNSLIDDEKVAGDKTFKWKQEFKQIMDDGGFDVVIGNPPYINIETMPQKEKEALKKYEVYAGKSDILYYFYNKGISLLKSGGILGFITSRYFIEATHAKNLRKCILENCEILKIIDLSNLPVFKDVGIHTVILILRKRIGETVGNKVFYKEVSKIEQIEDSKGTFLEQSNFDEGGWILGTKIDLGLFKKIDSCKTTTLGTVSIIEQGQKSGLNEAFTVTERIIQENKLEKPFIRKLVKNSYIKPYFIEDKGLYLIYASDEITSENAPNIISYLQKFKKSLQTRAEARDGLYPWYRLQRPRSKELFDANEKIVVPYRAENNRFGYDNQQRFNDGGDVRIIVIKSAEYQTKYILAILNSKLMNYYYHFIGRKKGSAFEYFVEPLQKIPIVKIDIQTQKKFVNLADKMLSLKKRLNEIGDKKTDERARIEEEINKTDAEIDELVYKLYGITESEKKIIEESLR